MIALSSLSTLSSNIFFSGSILFYMISRQIRHHDSVCEATQTFSLTQGTHSRMLSTTQRLSVGQPEGFFLSCDARKKALNQKQKKH